MAQIKTPPHLPPSPPIIILILGSLFLKIKNKLCYFFVKFNSFPKLLKESEFINEEFPFLLLLLLYVKVLGPGFIYLFIYKGQLFKKTLLLGFFFLLTSP
jgi:hypothetical protein